MFLYSIDLDLFLEISLGNIKRLTPKNILFVFVICNLLIGLWIVPDYGRSTDESPEDNSSNAALDMYVTNPQNIPIPEMYELGKDRFYGTAATSLFRFVERTIFPNTNHGPKVVAHYLYFIFFQISIVAVFYLCTYFVNGWSSLIAAFLFGTQPVLFGHAFINPKDIPIMAVFLLAVVSGFKMVDKWQVVELPTGGVNLPETEPQAERKRKKRERLFLVVILAIFIFIWSGGLIGDLFVRLVTEGYQNKGIGLVGQLFARMTTSGSLNGYQKLALGAVISILRWSYLVIPILLFGLFYFAKKYTLFQGYLDLGVLGAAALWGIAVSTRILAVAAGGIIGIYALMIMKKRAVFPLVIYSVTAMMISFVTWPMLWVEGFQGYFRALSLFGNFPWTGWVLFDGQLYLPKELPARYLPQLLAIQLTEPLVVFSLLGFGIGIYLFVKNKIDRAKLGLVIAWFLLPFFYTVFGHPTIYHNFRHLFFILPPLIVFAGLAFELLLSQLTRNIWISALVVLVLMPGIAGIVETHPYQSMYFNTFTGGVKGAENRYDFGYINTGYKVTMEYVNESVPSGSSILFWKEDLFGRLYAEHSYSFDGYYPGTELDISRYDYFIIPTSKMEETEFDQYPIAFAAEVSEVPIVYLIDLREDVPAQSD